MLDSFLIQIFIKGYSRKVFKESCKMIFAETGNGGNIIQTQIFRAMFLNIIADIQEFVAVFFLLIGGHIESVPHTGIFAADENQHLDQFGVDGGADQDGAAVIFPGDIKHQFLKPFVDGGRSPGRKQKRLRDGR